MTDRPNHITPAGFAKLRAEYEQLFAHDRPALVETISWAAGNGDRSENGDYIYGRKRLRELDRKLSHLSRIMKLAKIVDPASQDTDQVRFGATVEVADEDDNRRSLTIVGDDEADASQGLIGWSAPLARALIGARIGDERTVPVDREVAASWLTVGTAADGSFTVSADPAAIQPVVGTLPGLVDRAPANGVVFANAAGRIIDDSEAGQDGRTLETTDGIAAAFAEQLASGDAAYRLPVAVVPVTTDTVVRVLEVDLGEQRLYLKENDVVVDSWLVSTGRPGADTQTGRYTIGWKTPLQNMRGTAADSGVSYVQPNVKWAMYFNGDQAFHGVYWHSNWGNRMSAGCVGMPDSRAAQIYEWAVPGTDVWIHS